MFQVCDTTCTPCSRDMPYFYYTAVAIENQASVLLHFYGLLTLPVTPKRNILSFSLGVRMENWLTYDTIYPIP